MQVVCAATELLTGENIANDARCNFSRALLLPSLSVFEVIYGAGNSWTIRVLLRPFLDFIRGGVAQTPLCIACGMLSHGLNPAAEFRNR